MDVGSRLREAREAKGVSLETLSKVIRVKPAVLNAIERNDTTGIPPRPYGRGFVSAYASHVGLDPQQTVRAYFLQFAAPPAPSSHTPPPLSATSRVSGFPVERAAYVGAGVLLVALVGLAAPVLKRFAAEPAAPAASSRAPEPSASGSAPVGTGGSSQTKPASAEPGTPVAVEIEAVEPVWVTASVDAERKVYRTMRAGEHETLRGSEIAVRVGNAGLVRWRINGGAETVMGTRGAVQSVRVTPAGTEVQPSTVKRAPPVRRR
ncbi:MAG: RodZ domain-containing protein [Acidobacteriota bacterium]